MNRDSQNRQPHHDGNIFRTLLPDQITTTKTNIGQTRRNPWMLLTRCSEHRRMRTRTVFPVQIPLLGKDMVHKQRIQRNPIGRTMKSPVNTAQRHLQNVLLPRLDQGNRHLYIRPLPHNLVTQHNLIMIFHDGHRYP